MIELRDNRDLAFKVGAAALEDRVPLTEAELAKIFADYAVKVLCDQGKPFGMVVTKGPEIHLAIVPSYRRRWASRRLLNQLLQEPLTHGFAITSVMTDNVKGQNFVERLGFKRTHTDTVIHYRMVK